MCTVTIFPTPAIGNPSAPRRGFRMVCNRDEQHTRAPGKPPEVNNVTRDAGISIRFVAPTDPSGGGTWVGVNEYGVAATLLNLNLPDPPSQQRQHQSRGRLVLDALKHPTAVQAAEAIAAQTPPGSTLPFRLITADAATGVHLVRGDPQIIQQEPLGPISRRHFFTSSGLGDHVVQAPRETLFQETFAGLSDQAAYEQQIAFHHHQWPDKQAISIDTLRDDARTVSRTQVTVAEDAITVAYTPTDRGGNPLNTETTALPRPNATSTVTQPPNRKDQTQPSKRWAWAWKLYLLLVLVSFITQFFQTRPTPERSVTVPAMTATGPVADASKQVELAYHVYGENDTPQINVIALHGSPTMGQDFAYFGPDVAAITGHGVRIIAPNMPGFGESTRWVPNYGGEANAYYVLALMDALGINQAHIVGYSHGSATAIRLTDFAPARIGSICLLGGIGDQAFEGTGDYGFEHFKYAAAYVFGFLGLELVPHFGVLPRHVRHGFARSFWDLDQRPYAQLLAEIPPSIPVQILNGADDNLVLVDTARQHHTLVEHSELFVYEGGHGDVLSPNTAKPLAELYSNFLLRKTVGGEPAKRRTADPAAPHDELEQAQLESLTKPLKLKDTASPWLKTAVIALATFVSEDYTCISVGLLINYGHTDLFLGVLACFLGIFIGDIILFVVGRIAGQRVLKWGPIKKWAPTETVDEIANWYERYGFVAVFASRFMPGTRFPLYVTAGVVGSRASKFILWAAISDIIYTPLIVILVAVFGDQLAGPLTAYFGKGWIALLLSAALLFLALRLLVYTLTADGRRQLKIKLLKMRHHEWWPAWFFYLPMIPVWLFLAVRYRSLTCWTAANPAMPDGGIIGESKADILSALPPEAVIPWALIKGEGEASSDDRLDQLRTAMSEHGWSYPMILKPDVGERGTAVRKMQSDQDAHAYFDDIQGDVIAQVYDPGPHECGIFYVRQPEEKRGCLFAITDKTFPVLMGDGQHTLKELIHAHPRFRMQADLYLRRLHHRRHEILAEGETLPLTTAGNHAQGCMFTDGAHLYSDALTDAIDEICQPYEGFYFGRFDVRYQDPAALERGQDIRIVELNGVTSEATNLYDPEWSPWRAYKQLAAQWDWCFKIGRTNVDQGTAATSVWTLIKILFGRFRAEPRPIAN